MFSKKDNKGFTLMEMLIVVAIIAILIAIMIPVFNAQLEKSREAADAANIRSAYAEVMVCAIDGEESGDVTKDATTGAFKAVVELGQEQSDWQNTDLGTNLAKLGTVTGTPAQGGSCTVSVATGASDYGTVTIAFED